MKTVQFSFGGGEMSPAMFGRADDQKYQQGLALCKNFIPLPQGAVRNRPGFAYVRAAKYTDKTVRLIPFKYSSSDTMVLELGDKYMRFHSQGETLMNYNGTVYEISTPYAAEDLAGIKYTQSADVLTLVHKDYPPKELKRYSVLDWRLETISFDIGLKAPTITGVTYNANGNTSSIRFNIRYKVTSLKDTDEGVVESEGSSAFTIASNLYYDESTNVITWSAVSGAARYRVYKSMSGLYGYIGETSDLSFTDDNIAADESITPPRYDTIFKSSGSIQSATITAVGSGYTGPNGEVTGVTLKSKETWAIYTDITEKDGATSTEWPSEATFYANSGHSIKMHVISLGCEVTQDIVGLFKAEITVVDAEGTGSGCVLEPVYATYLDFFAMDGIKWYDGFGEGKAGFCPVTGVTIKSAGSGYTRPVVTVTITQYPTFSWSTYNNKGRYVRSYVGTFKRYSGTYDVSATTAGFASHSIVVTDSTGSGAILTPEFSGGKLSKVNIIDGGSGYTNPTATVISSYGSGAKVSVSIGEIGDYPGAVTYYEQRRFFGGTRVRPQMLWATRPGTESDMSYTIPTQDDNRIKFRIAAQQASRIQHLIPISQLLVLTESAEFLITSPNSDALTATSFSAKPQAYVGASQVQPVIINNTAIYAANRGGHLRELGYNRQAQCFVTADLSVRAPHFFETDRIRDMTIQAAPEQIIWMASDEGYLYGLTYLPEQNVGAWHRHTTTHGSFESVACVSESGTDIVYASVKRTINGKEVRYIERMNPLQQEKLEKAFFVDSGATYYGAPTRTVSGLTWLEGETVSILADGAVMPQQVVTDGKITLDSDASRITIGLPIEADIQTLPFVVQMQDGSYGKGWPFNVNKVWLQVYQSSGIWVGPTFDSLREAKQRTTEPYGKPPELVTGQVPVLTSPGWKNLGEVCVRQSDPLPLMVVGLCAEIAT